MTPRESGRPPTAMGTPRSAGLSRISTAAKKQSMSMWMILRMFVVRGFRSISSGNRGRNNC